ncbi:MAG: NADH-quinone oxidoreductase subunit I [Candidatus Latescibacteria bacterium]|jgi:NADH-quinone oxidoreductase subunit I|nr:NADH-quinone oxidoreductase subunit I [Candidatus Latescibacterota bacterium]
MVNYFRNLFEAGWSVWVGMNVTLKHLFVPSVTLQYPEEKAEMFERSRGQLYCDIDDCIGCDQCARACPVDCIYIDTEKAGKDEDLGVTSKGTKKRLKVLRFDIDMSLCCYCALCVSPCPTECLKMTPQYESSTYEREGLLYVFARPEMYETKTDETAAPDAAETASTE